MSVLQLEIHLTLVARVLRRGGHDRRALQGRRVFGLLGHDLESKLDQKLQELESCELALRHLDFALFDLRVVQRVHKQSHLV